MGLEGRRGGGGKKEAHNHHPLVSEIGPPASRRKEGTKKIFERKAALIDFAMTHAASDWADGKSTYLGLVKKVLHIV